MIVIFFLILYFCQFKLGVASTCKFYRRTRCRGRSSGEKYLGTSFYVHTYTKSIIIA